MNNNLLNIEMLSQDFPEVETAKKAPIDLGEAFETYLNEEFGDTLVEGPFDIFKKKALTPEQDAYAKSVRAACDKMDFVPVNPRAGLDKSFFDTVGAAQHQTHRLWTNCYMITCPEVNEEGELAKPKGAATKVFSTALQQAINYAADAHNSGKVKAYKKVFGDLPMPILFCVTLEDAVSPAVQEAIKKYQNMPRVKDFGATFSSSLGDAIVIGAYYINAKEDQEFRMPVRVREVFCNGLGELVNLEGVTRDPKTGEAIK